MKIFQWLVIMKWVNVVFGEGYLKRLIVFECKYLFSIYFNVWKTIEHDRFHTHAFSAISIMLRGEYDEERLADDGTVTKYTLKAPLVRFISRTNNHRMLKARGTTWSIALAGPWDKIWTETLVPNGEKRFLSWGRKILFEQGNNDKKNING